MISLTGITPFKSVSDGELFGFKTFIVLSVGLSSVVVSTLLPLSIQPAFHLGHLKHVLPLNSYGVSSLHCFGINIFVHGRSGHSTAGLFGSDGIDTELCVDIRGGSAVG
jgi:hypothetical protein